MDTGGDEDCGDVVIGGGGVCVWVWVGGGGVDVHNEDRSEGVDKRGG